MSIGSILKEELDNLGITENELADDLDLDRKEVKEIVADRRSIDLIIAEKFAKYFETSPDVWLDAQYNLGKQMEVNRS